MFLTNNIVKIIFYLNKGITQKLDLNYKIYLFNILSIVVFTTKLKYDFMWFKTFIILFISIHSFYNM